MNNERLDDNLLRRRRLKVFKNRKAYDRIRDRKRKSLYEVDVEDGNYEESQVVFQSGKSNG